MVDKKKHLKKIYKEIKDMIGEKSRVLDLGCGNGELLSLLIKEKQVSATGVEINEKEILSCIKKGISVIQEDIDEGLDKYKNKTYDYVILSQTLQVVTRPDYVLKQIARIGKKAVVSFPNFGHYRIRFELLLGGRMPKSKTLPYEWHNTPNIHLLTINDFKAFCKENGIKILNEIYHVKGGKKLRFGPANLFAEEAIFLIQKR